MRGLPADTQYLKDFLATVEGPIVLVGHSYGGMDISNAVGNAKVKALAYSAGYGPTGPAPALPLRTTRRRDPARSDLDVPRQPPRAGEHY